MPCYDPDSGRGSTRTVEVENPINNRLVQSNQALEAGLCAVFSELERRGIAADVAISASRSGLIDLMDFWEHHSKGDYSRLAKEIHKYSKDEQEVIRKILGNP